MKSSLTKISLCVAFILLLNNSVFAQCGTKITQKHKDYIAETWIKRLNRNNSIHSISSNNEYVLPLSVHIIKRSNGTGGFAYKDLANTVETLNKQFRNSNISFIIKTLNYINDNAAFSKVTYSENCESNSTECHVAKENLISHSINVFFTPNLEADNLDVGGWASLPGDKKDKNWIFIENKAALDGKTLAHEMGHFFNLYHTHHGERSEAEIEWKDELADGSNCGLQNVGDELCDTPAEPNYSNKGILNCIDSYCKYTCNIVDKSGPFEPLNENFFNTMSYANPECPHQFTPEQLNRMFVSLLEDRPELLSGCKDIFDEFAWVNRQTSCTGDTITVFDFKNTIKFITINSNNETKLYLMDEQRLCQDNKECLDYFNSILTDVVDSCTCTDSCKLIGCMDENAIDYNPYADCKDNTLCNYALKGCVIPTACNYNPEAEVDDNSCYFGNEACDDPCDETTCIDCSKYSGTIIFDRCGLSLKYLIETDDGQMFNPVFNDVFPFTIRPGKRVTFDYEVFPKSKGEINSICRNAANKIRITCMEEISENKPDNNAASINNGSDEGLFNPNPQVQSQTNDAVKIYPNLTKGIFYLIINNKVVQQTVISIYNIVGKKITSDIQMELKTGKFEFDISNHPKGIYFVEVNNGFKSQTNKILLE